MANHGKEVEPKADDSNKIIGTEIAVSTAVYVPSLEKKKSEYNYNPKLLVDPLFMEMNALTLEMLDNCVDELEKLGTYDELAAKYGYHGEGYKNSGLVVQSTLDPRLVLSVEFGRRWSMEPGDEVTHDGGGKQSCTFKWFANTEHDSFGAVGVLPEHPATPEELDIITKLREDDKKHESYQPVLGQFQRRYISESMPLLWKQTPAGLEVSLKNKKDAEGLHGLDFHEAFEYLFQNGMENITPEEAGALTDAPIFGEVRRDDEGNLEEIYKAYSFPDYTVEDPVQKLQRDGKVVFTNVELEPKEDDSAGSDDTENDGPQEDDITITPSGNLGSKYFVSIVGGGHYIGEFDTEEEAEAAIKSYMKDNNYFPTVWDVSDHGNASIHTMSTGEPDESQDIGTYMKAKIKGTKGESKIQETGEPDQDYDHEVFDAIVNGLKKAGFEAKHREFDKYQGVYITVSKKGKLIDKLWQEDYYVIGKKKQSQHKYSHSYLEDNSGNQFSATPGDYWQMGKNDRHKNLTLVLVGHDGKKTRIKNPKQSDLVYTDNGTIEYEGKPDDVLVFRSENQDLTSKVTVTPEGKADVSELIALLKGNKMKKNEGIEFNDWEAVSLELRSLDFFGVPKMEEDGYKPTFAPAKSPYVADVAKTDKIVDKKAAILKPTSDKQVPVGSAIAKAATTVDVGVKSGEKPVPDADIKPGDPDDEKPEIMQGKGKSDDQQKDLPASAVKTGKASDGHGKVMSDSKAERGHQVSEQRRNQVAELMKKSMGSKVNEARKKKMQEKLQKRYGK